MPSPDPAAGHRSVDVFAEAGRQLTICNSCRYCAGFCPVWPELELRTTLDHADLTHLANLCHDCQDCYTACMYTAPHEFDLNPPKVFAELREDTQRRYVRPGPAGRTVLLVGFLAACALLGVLGWLSTGHPVPLATGSPYRILAYPLMVALVAAPAAWSATVLLLAAFRYWRDTHGPLADLLRPRLWPRTLRQALTLHHMRGGGAGCDYPGPAPGTARRRSHQILVYGFALCTLSTVSAAFQQDVLALPPTYPVLSVPVLTGTAGGLAMLAGATALLLLKQHADDRRTTPTTRRADQGLLTALLVLAATGLLTLALRDRAPYGPLLLLHLAAVTVAFALLPYTKAPHALYRLLAIHKHNLESATGLRAGGGGV